MAPPDDTLATRRDGFIARARTLLAGDPRRVAGWLEGSVAEGTDDPYTNVDLYLSVRDDAVEAA